MIMIITTASIAEISVSITIISIPVITATATATAPATITAHYDCESPLPPLAAGRPMPIITATHNHPP